MDSCKCVQRWCQERRAWVVDIPSPKCQVQEHAAKALADGEDK